MILNNSNTNNYRLFKGFKKLGEYATIREAKAKAPKTDGVYNLKGPGGYWDSWQIVSGLIIN